jgi:RNA polymerase II subunit A small phosphatase-like protein
LILDLDETLVHSSQSLPPAYDFKIALQKKPKNVYVYVNTRPFLAEFLEIVKDLYEVVVFTSGVKYVGLFKMENQE